METEVKKDTSCGKVILFAIGVLVGAVIATTAFLISANVLKDNNSNNTQQNQSQQGGTPPEMPSGQSSQNGQGGTPPDKPSGSN